MKQSLIGRRYALELGAAMLVYAVVLIASIEVGQRMRPGLWLDIVVLTPMVPIGFAIAAVTRFMTQSDELQQALQLKALAMTVAATSFITLAYGFLEGVGFPRISMFFVWPFMGVVWVIASFVLRRPYE
ncbi:MAG: hypothetical protein M3Y21_04345 [Candidatus Eremiobacteraeota bacterium]|nr:hypothetical protein [Candidatus Eremiobacteraeota bacterium]